MVSICGKRYESYDEAAQDQLGVSKNSLYRFMKRENLPQMSIVEILEYCINNGISKDQILPKRKRHFTKSFEQAMIEKYGVDNYKKMFIPEENDVNANEIGHQSHTYVNVHCLCKTPHFIKNIEAFKVFRIKEGWCPYKSHTAGNKYILYEDSLGNLYPEIYTIWSDRNQHRPEEMYPTAKGEYWFKCENGFHEDYIRSLSTQISCSSL